MISTLSAPEKLRLRSAFDRWQRNPSFFASEISAARDAVNDAEKYGWRLSVDRHGVPTARPPANMALSPRELARFSDRLDTMTEEEFGSARAALVAIGTRGFSARVDARGHLIAVPPSPQCQRVETDPIARANEYKKFWSRGSYAFKSLPSKLV